MINHQRLNLMSNPRGVKGSPFLHMKRMNISFNHMELCFAPYVIHALSMRYPCVIRLFQSQTNVKPILSQRPQTRPPELHLHSR